MKTLPVLSKYFRMMTLIKLQLYFVSSIDLEHSKKYIISTAHYSSKTIYAFFRFLYLILIIVRSVLSPCDVDWNSALWMTPLISDNVICSLRRRDI